MDGAEAEEDADPDCCLEPAALEVGDGLLLLEEALVAALWARKATSRFARKGRLVGIVRVVFYFLTCYFAPGVVGSVVSGSPPGSYGVG